jgi:hypothetical protein
MADPVLHRDAGLEAPAWIAAAVTPADADLPKIATRALYVGGTGDVAVVMSGGGAVTFVNVQGGTVLPIRVDRVSAATDATDIVALY